jgi:hypothetical protein
VNGEQAVARLAVRQLEQCLRILCQRRTGRDAHIGWNIGWSRVGEIDRN